VEKQPEHLVGGNMDIKLQFEFIKQWIIDRLGERTTWDGAVIIAICGLVLVALPIIKWVAWLGIIYGLWTLWKKQS